MLRRMSPIVVVGTLLAKAVCQAAADNLPQTVFDTGTPPSAFGTDGFDVSAQQSVAQRFFMNVDGPLATVELWFMSNGDGTPPLPSVQVSVVRGNLTTPSTLAEDVLESWNINVTAAGWTPTQTVLTSSSNPELSFGGFYWIVASSADAPPANAVWCESNTLAFGTTTDGSPSTWQPGASGNAAAVKVTVAISPLDAKQIHQ